MTHEQDFPFVDQLDVSRSFRKMHKLSRRPSMREAAASLSVEFEGQQHRAIDDAHCLADILIRLISDEGARETR